MRKIIILLLFTLPLFCTAQKRGNVWCFGDSAGIDFSNTSNPVPIVTSLDTRGSCVSVSDTSGILQFYANTRAGFAGNTGLVWNKDHWLMQNGDSIVGQGWYNEFVTVPFPSSDSLYYLFSLTVTNSSLPSLGLYYSVVDLSQNAGLGTVTQKNVQLRSFACDDGINAIKHGNRRDWWLMFRKSGLSPGNPNNNFFRYLISPSGISGGMVQSIGSINNVNSGKITFSPRGDKMIYNNRAGLLELFDFDRCTGVLSNPITIFPQQLNPPRLFFGCEFSPNGNVLYVTISDQTSYLFQFDLTAPNIAASIDTLWQTSFPGEAIGGLKRGPDGKIYESGPYTNPTVFVYPYPDSMRNVYNENLGVINNPDVLGSGCDFQPYSFYLGGKRTYWGLPNNPDYDMPALAGSLCDSLTTGVATSGYQETKPQLFVTYVNGWQKLFVNAQNLRGKNCTLQIFDITGKLIYSNLRRHSTLGAGGSAGGYFTTDITCTALAKGMYIVTLTTESERLSVKFIKE